MDAEAYRRKARDLFAVAQLANRPKDKAAMLSMAAHWIERAEEAERNERTRQQMQKEPVEVPDSGVRKESVSIAPI